MDMQPAEKTSASGIGAFVRRGLGLRRDAPEEIAAWLGDAFPYLIGIYLAVWTLVSAIVVKWLTFSGLAYDSYEMLLMGHEWQPSYWKHPALPPWITEAVYVVSGHSAFALDLLTVLWVAVSLWLVYRLCEPIFGKAGALLATVLSLGSWFVMTPLGHFNHNFAQMPFWVLTVYFYRRAVLKPSYGDWIALALSAAFLLQTKFTGVLLLATLAGHLLWFPQGRKALLRPEAWVGIVLAAMLLGAQLLQVVLQSRSVLGYAVYERPAFHGVLGHIIGPLALLGSELAFHLPIALFLLAAYPFTARQRARSVAIALPPQSPFDTSLLVASTAVPLVLGILFFGFAGVAGRSEGLGSMFMLVGPSVLAAMGPIFHMARPRLVAAMAALILLGPPLGGVLNPILDTRLGHRASTEQIPFDAAQADLERDWRARTGRPLTIIAGEARDAGGFAAFMPQRASVLQDGDPSHSPWITKARIATEGVLFVWRIKNARDPAPPPDLLVPLANYPIERLPPLRIATRWDAIIAPVLFGRAMIRPGHAK
jgi:4-amino-4-deoxy-L-arabinose transferase-like glycosyltransferase